MKKQTLTLTFALLLATFAAQNLSADTEVFIGKVIGVADGDTITVRAERRLRPAGENHKLRLSGIDCPQLEHSLANKWGLLASPPRQRQELDD